MSTESREPAQKVLEQKQLHVEQTNSPNLRTHLKQE